MVGIYSIVFMILASIGTMLQFVDLGYYIERSMMAGILVILSFMCGKIFVDNFKKI